MEITKSNAWDAISDQLKAKEVERHVVEEMTRKVEYILSESPDDGLRWGGAKADLLEMLKMVADKGAVVSDDGMPVEFISLTREVFGILNEKMISNPYAMAVRGSQRKGVRKKSFVDRLSYVILSDDGTKIDRFWSALIIKTM